MFLGLQQHGEALKCLGEVLAAANGEPDLKIEETNQPEVVAYNVHFLHINSWQPI